MKRAARSYRQLGSRMSSSKGKEGIVLLRLLSTYIADVKYTCQKAAWRGYAAKIWHLWHRRYLVKAGDFGIVSSRRQPALEFRKPSKGMMSSRKLAAA